MTLTINQIAKMIDHSLLHPTMTDAELEAGCALAKKYNVASVCIKPYAVLRAVEWLAGSEVKVGTVIGFPHGSHSLSVKAFEARQALNDGATELDMVVNIGKVLSGEWDYIHREIRTLNQLTLDHGAILKVIFENDYLPGDELKTTLCHISSDCNVAFVKTSTGYGFVKQENGFYAYRGATDHDLALMRRESAPSVQVKAAGGVRTLDDLLRVHALGVTRIGATATESIIQTATERGFPA